MRNISIAIPCYEMSGHGVEVLEYSFRQLEIQTYRDFDVVISDDSADSEIMSLCKRWDNRLDIRYYKNKVRGAASNTGNSIVCSTGKWIKLLCQDDYLLNENSLQITVDNLTESCNWLASAYYHTYDRVNLIKPHTPSMNGYLCTVNTIGTPSCVTLRNVKDMPPMDTTLTYMYDCDFYYRFWHQYGPPRMLNELTMVNYLWEASVTSGVSPELIQRESKYILGKYGLN